MPEIDLFIADDGTQIVLGGTRGRAVLTEEGTGMPPVEYITQRAPFQQGESVLDRFLRPRVIQLLVRHKFCSREAYWQGRQELLTALNKTGVLRKIRHNGVKRDFSVRILEGPKFEASPPNTWQAWSYQEVLRFVAHNPVAFNPTQKSHTIEHPSAHPFPYTFPFFFSDYNSDLTYPITYPIQFITWDYTEEVTYAGTWKDYPRVTINGPVGPRSYIENVTTGHSIVVQDYYVEDGDYIYFDLTTSTKTLRNSSGEDISEYASGDLAEFALEPGVNEIRARLDSGGGGSSVVLSWYERFIGV